MPIPGRLLVASIAAVLSVMFTHTAFTGETNPNVEFIAKADGSVEVEGLRFTDAEELKKKVAEVKARTPQPTTEVLVQDGAVDMQRLGQALVLLHNAGLITMGFITSPRTK